MAVALHQEVGGVWLRWRWRHVPLLRGTLEVQLLEVSGVRLRVHLRGDGAAVRQLAGTHDVGVNPQPQAGLHKGV